MTNCLIAYQGEPGAYSEIAALRIGQPKPCESFEEVFAAVEKHEADYAVIPIENSLGGSIHQNYDLLLQHPVVIVAETFVKVEHCLLGLQGSSVQHAEKVLSHPQALAQCRNFFSSHKHLKAEVAYDTAGSAKIIAAEKNPNSSPLRQNARENCTVLRYYRKTLLTKSGILPGFSALPMQTIPTHRS